MAIGSFAVLRATRALEGDRCAADSTGVSAGRVRRGLEELRATGCDFDSGAAEAFSASDVDSGSAVDCRATASAFFELSIFFSGLDTAGDVLLSATFSPVIC